MLLYKLLVHLQLTPYTHSTYLNINILHLLAFLFGRRVFNGYKKNTPQYIDSISLTELSMGPYTVAMKVSTRFATASAPHVL